MKIIFFIFSLVVFICHNTNGQKVNSDFSSYTLFHHDTPIILTKVHFEIGDSICKYTQFAEPDGKYYFRPGFEHNDESLGILVSFDSATKKNRPFLKWSSEEIYAKSRFSSFETQQKPFVNTYDYEYNWYPYINELFYTSIQDSLELEDIFEKRNNNVLRLTQLKTSFSGPSKIQFYEITWDESKKYNVRYINAIIDSSLKIKTSGFNYILNKSDSKRFERQLRNAEEEDITYFTKTEQLEPFLFELKSGDKYTVIKRSNGYELGKKCYSEYCYFLTLIENMSWQYKRAVPKQKSKRK